MTQNTRPCFLGKLPELVVELRRKRLVVGDNKGGHLKLCYHIRHRKRLP